MRSVVFVTSIDFIKLIALKTNYATNGHIMKELQRDIAILTYNFTIWNFGHKAYLTFGRNDIFFPFVSVNQTR